MPKVYAIVQPACTDNGSSADVVNLLVAPFHYFAYERICGYSLGNKVTFYNTLEDAKAYFTPELVTKDSRSWGLDVRRQSAIIELDTKDGELNEILNIIKFDGYKSVFKKSEDVSDAFEQHFAAQWYTRQIKGNDVTVGAFTVLSNEYLKSQPPEASVEQKQETSPQRSKLRKH